MTNSKHHMWQTRWAVDRAARTATHESGLVVSMPGTEPRANNGAQVMQQLALKNGHNAAAMVARLLREAAALIEDRPYVR